MVGVVPASLLGIAAGGVYGVVLGFLLAAAGTLIGGWLAFKLARSLLRPWVERMLARRGPGRMARLDEAVTRDGWRFVCLLRISPRHALRLDELRVGADRNFGTGLPSWHARVIAGSGRICVGRSLGPLWHPDGERHSGTRGVRVGADGGRRCGDWAPDLSERDVTVAVRPPAGTDAPERLTGDWRSELVRKESLAVVHPSQRYGNDGRRSNAAACIRRGRSSCHLRLSPTPSPNVGRGLHLHRPVHVFARRRDGSASCAVPQRAIAGSERVDRLV